jgi:hypothetical protein
VLEFVFAEGDVLVVPPGLVPADGGLIRFLHAPLFVAL